MLQASTIQFIKDLSKNNNKPWFDEHRDNYAAAKKDFETLVVQILEGLAVSEPAFREQKAKDCVFRIFRDVRFSNDKTPYKSHFGASFSIGGKKATGAGYYLHLEPGKTFAGGGIWMPDAPALKAIRQEIDYNFKDFKAIVNQKQFVKTFGKIEGEQLKTTPKGYEADNEAIEYLKMKSFVVHRPIDDKQITDKALADICLTTFKTMKPMIDFLNNAVA